MSRRPWPELLAAAGYVAAGGLIATALAWPIYQHPQALVVGIVGTVLGVGIATVGVALRLPWWADALTALGVYFLVSVPLAVPGLFPSHWLEGLRDAIVGVVVGWKQLVTLDLPVGDYQAVLVPLLVVTLAGTTAATRVAGAAGRAVIVAPLLLVAMAGFGVAFGTSQILSSGPLRALPRIPGLGSPQVLHLLVAGGLLIVLLTIGWFALRGRQQRRAALARAAGVAQTEVRVHRGSAGALLRRGGLAAAMLVVAVVVGGAVAIPALQLGREVIRDSTSPLELVAPMASPLESYRQWLNDDRYDADLFTVRVVGGGEVDRLRFAALDEYDGTRFRLTDPAGASRFTRLPSPGHGASATVRLDIADGYRQPWVPLPGDLGSAAEFPVDRDRAIELEDGVYYAADGSGAVVLAPGTGGHAEEPGLRAGDAVLVVGAVAGDARAAIAGIAGGDPLHGVDADTFPELVGWVESQHPQAGGQGLLDLIDALRARGYLSHALVGAEDARWVEDVTERVPGFELKASRSGHAVDRIEALFSQLTERQRQVVGAGGVIDATTDAAALVAGVGDDEQFAAAGALIAWSLGIEARVAVGVHLDDGPAMRPPGGGELAVEACATDGDGYRCTGANVAAWVEVRVGDAWLPLDTSPQLTELPRVDREGEQPPPHGTQPERPSTSVVDPPGAAPPEGDAGAAPDDPPGPLPAATASLLRVIVVGAGAVGLLALPPLCLVAAKALRRRRRRDDDPETSIVGAWDELVDLAIDHRVISRADGTRRQLAERIGGVAAMRLAEVADLAVFGERAPVEAQRDAAWELVSEAHGDLREGVAFMKRIRAALDPTSFVRHLGTGAGARARRAEPRGIRLAGEVR